MKLFVSPFIRDKGIVRSFLYHDGIQDHLNELIIVIVVEKQLREPDSNYRIPFYAEQTHSCRVGQKDHTVEADNDHALEHIIDYDLFLRYLIIHSSCPYHT